jgi:hypothetical protein
MNIKLIYCISLAVVLCSTIQAQDTATTKQLAHLELASILKNLHAANPQLEVQQDIADLKCNDAFTQEEILTLSKLALKKITEFDELKESPAYTQLEEFMAKIVNQLKDYKVTGVGLAQHLSLGLLYENQNFTTNLLLKNSAGAISTRTFSIDYSSIGWQWSSNYRFDAIFTIGADLNRYTTSNPLQFGFGITGNWVTPIPSFEINLQINIDNNHDIVLHRVGFTSLGFTVLPFKNTAGYMVIAHIGINPLGINQQANPFSPYAFNAGVVLSGGSFTSQTQN